MAFTHELYLSVASLILFCLTLTSVKAGTPRMAALVLAAGAIASAAMGFGAHGDLFSGVYRVDVFSQSFKLIIAIGFFLAVAFAEGTRGVEPENEADYYLFLSLSILGLTFLVSSNELLAIYISLELSSYALYILVPLRNGKFSEQTESGIKYVLFGAMASGISLFGMSYVFGLAQTTSVDALIKVYPAIASTPMGMLGLAMMFAGFFFKLALFPMHLWTPDIYQGAANETSGVIATLPKVGAVAVLIRLSGLGVSAEQFTNLLIVLAVLSMTYGNLAALAQTDLKRLLAFSSISHAGYMMAGILSGSVNGYAGAMYYVGGYVIMNLALFHVIYSLSKDGGNVTFEDLKGLSKREPIMALTLAVGAFGLAGIPPTAGFAGKFFVLQAAFQKGHNWLVIFAALNTAISAFYYLKMFRAAYTAESPECAGGCCCGEGSSISTKALAVVFSLAILLMGSLPDAILNVFRSAITWVS